MIVSVASGKGGTGKTTVSASLATVWEGPVVAVDLDVEEPNLHLFLHPEIEASEAVYMTVPEVLEARCTFCGACSDLCQFKAISVMNQLILAFPEMCHGCGGCMAICPEHALSPGRRELGWISRGRAGKADFLTGSLRVGEAMSPPLMREVKARLDAMIAVGRRDAILDAPPGVSCPAVNAVIDSDVILLVTEPTPFGFHDFRLAVQAFSPLGKPMGVVLNRTGQGNDDVHRFCKRAGLPILAQIPYDRAIAEAYARGRVIAEVNPEFRELFEDLAGRVRRLAEEPASLEAIHA